MTLHAPARTASAAYLQGIYVCSICARLLVRPIPSGHRVARLCRSLCATCARSTYAAADVAMLPLTPTDVCAALKTAKAGTIPCPFAQTSNTT